MSLFVRSLIGALFLFFLVGCEVTPSAATAQRPTFSSDTATTAVNTFELEAGVAIDPRDQFDSPTTLKYGLSEESELSLSWSPHQWVEAPGSDGRGGGDAVIATRHRFFEEVASGYSAALQLATKLPTGSERDGLSSGELDFFAAGIATAGLDQATVTAFYQLGFLGETAGSDFDIEHGIALGAATPAFDNVSIFGELATVLAHEQDREEVFTTLGLSYALDDSFVLDAAVVVGLSRDAPDFQLVFGITKNFGQVHSWFTQSGEAPDRN